QGRSRRRLVRGVARSSGSAAAVPHQREHRRRQESGWCRRVGTARARSKPACLRRPLPTCVRARGLRYYATERRMKRMPLTWMAVLAALVASAAFAQTAFPTHTVKVIVPFPGGGINDVLARIVGDKLQARWGQPVVIENKTGAGGNIGATAAYQSD